MKAGEWVKTGVGYPAFFNQKTYIKHESDTSHLPIGMIRKYTGKSNRVILKNLEYLSSLEQRIVIRFPLIPGITDTDENISDILHLMKKLGLKEIDLEPYHSLGVAKYAELGMKYSLHGCSDHSGYPVDRLKTIGTRMTRILK